MQASFHDVPARSAVDLIPLGRGAPTAEGVRFIPMTSDQFGAFMKIEIAKCAPVVKASGAKAD